MIILLLEELRNAGVLFPDQVRSRHNATGSPYWYLCTRRTGAVSREFRYKCVWICVCPVGERFNPGTQKRLRLLVEDRFSDFAIHTLGRFLSLPEAQKAKVLAAVGGHGPESISRWRKFQKLCLAPNPTGVALDFTKKP